MDYQKLLLACDDHSNWEFPPNHDWNIKEKRFLKLASDLELVLGRKLIAETGSLIQDASFHSQIHIELSDHDSTFIRFSNFGNLVTAYAVSDEESVPGDLLTKITQLLHDHSYLYVPYEVLNQPYPVQAGIKIGIRDWFYRYFDYL